MADVAVAGTSGAADDHAVGMFGERADLPLIEAEAGRDRLRVDPFVPRRPEQVFDKRFNLADRRRWHPLRFKIKVTLGGGHF